MAMTVKNTFLQVVDDDDLSEDEFQIGMGTPLRRQQSEPAPKPSSRASVDTVTLSTIAESMDSLPAIAPEANAGSGSGSEDPSWEDDEIEKQDMLWARVVTQDALEQREVSANAFHAAFTSTQPIMEQGIGEEEESEEGDEDEEEEDDEEQGQQQASAQYMNAMQMQMMYQYQQAYQQQQQAMRYGSSPADPGFTVMVRNVPNKYSRDLFVKELDETGFQGAFDFIYLPIDPETRANKGYGFVNFVNTAWANMFMNMYQGRKMSQFDSDKRIAVSPAVLQGFEANYAHYSTKYINQQDEKMRPLYLREPSAQTLQSISGGLSKPLSKKKLRRVGKSSLIDKAAQQQVLNRLGYTATPFNGNHPNVLMGMPAQAPASSTMPVHSVKFCTYCGAKVQNSFKFCQSCGTNVAKA